MKDYIGWISSIILMATIFVQIHKQWKERSAKAVSKWMFGGQVLSCAGFAIYSYLIDSWVFVFTNTFLLFTNLLGFTLTLRFKKANET